MKTRQTKIDKIYEKISRKELTFGCRVRVKCEEIELQYFTSDDTNIPDLDWTTWIVEWLYWSDDFNLWIRMEIEKIYFDDPSYEWHKISDEFKNEFHFFESEEWIEIIWHPIMFGDIITFIEKNISKLHNQTENKVNWFDKKEEILTNKIMECCSLFKKKTKPIEEQSNKCIDFIYNIITK